MEFLENSSAKTLKEVNLQFSPEVYPVMPYRSPLRITPLKEGLYCKHNAKFHGITAIYDKELNEYRYPLYGMYWLPSSIVIVPEGIEMTSGKQALLDAYIKAGYTQMTTAPQFETFYVPQDSHIARLALENKLKYNETLNRHDTIRNGTA